MPHITGYYFKYSKINSYLIPQKLIQYKNKRDNVGNYMLNTKNDKNKTKHTHIVMNNYIS